MEPRDNSELDFLHFLLGELNLSTTAASPFIIKYSRLVLLSPGLRNSVVFLVFTEKESGTRIITTLNTSCSQWIRSRTATHFMQYQINNVFSAQQAIEGWQEQKVNTQIGVKIEMSVSGFYIYYV